MKYDYILNNFYDWQAYHSLSSTEIALYHALAFVAGKCNKMTFATAISVLEHRSGCSGRTIFRVRKQLAEKGLISINQQRQNACAEYTLLPLDEDNKDINQSKTECHSVVQSSHSVCHSVIQCDKTAANLSPLVIYNNSLSYIKFIEWSSINIPNVAKMRTPMSQQQFEKLIQEYDKRDIIEVLLSMENYAELHKKNNSAYLTARNWLNRRLGKNEPKVTPVSKVGTIVSTLNDVVDVVEQLENSQSICEK